MSEWRLIETAPKDGSAVLLVRMPDESCCVGEWKGGKWVFCEAVGCEHYLVEPTHWMPLPEPPEES